MRFRQGRFPAAAAPSRQSGFVVGLLLILCAAIGFVLFLVGSSYGAALLLRVALNLPGEGQAQGVSGSLYDGLHVSTLRYRGQGMSVEADGLRLQVDWLALRERQLRLVEVGAERLALDLPPPDDPADDEPFEMPDLPDWPELPVAVSFERVFLNELALAQGGEPAPWRLSGLLLDGRVDQAELRLNLRSLQVATDDAALAGEGWVQLEAPAADPLAPGVSASLALTAWQGAESPAAELRLVAEGTLEDLQLSLTGQGYDLDLSVQAQLAPFSATLPVTELRASVRGFEPQAWLPELPEARLDLDLNARLQGALWRDGQVGALDLEALQTELSLAIASGSRWRGQPLQGSIELQQAQLRLPHLAADLRLGRNRVQFEGGLGALDDAVQFSVQVPAPAQIWPGLAGAIDLRGRVQGLPEKHELTVRGALEVPREWLPALNDDDTPRLVDGEIRPADDPVLDIAALLAEQNYQLDLAIAGAWGLGEPGQAWPDRLAWRGMLQRLRVSSSQLGVELGERLALAVAPATETQPLAWQAGSTRVQFRLPEARTILLVHRGSAGEGETWQTSGSIDDLVPAWILEPLPRSGDVLRLDLDWDLGVAEALRGEVRVQRRAGDVIIPGDTPLALGLQRLQLQLNAEPRASGVSDLRFALDLAGDQIGVIRAEGTTETRLQQGVPVITEQQPIRVDADLRLDDLGWLVAFTGDENEVGGRIRGQFRLERLQGEWSASGALQGEALRIVRVDDGVRLLDGSLSARFSQDVIEVESLRFPSVVRGAPRDSHVQSWVARHADSGYLEATGFWSLSEAAGEAKVTISHYPLVQRADRFVAGSGEVQVQASPRRLGISGKVTADVGWISLEGSEDLPTLASDVVIVQPDGQIPTPSSDFPLRLNLDIDFGNQMLLTGLGLTTRLAGSINVRNTAAGLRATGVVNTQDGRFSIYGQTLEVRRGTVTFQGLLDDPLLDIVAVRPNLQVQAGVQVSGTARAPEISLVSFPDVPETEKLSWLLLGRGPDARGADAGLLLSAAASLLGDSDSEPLSAQLGLDELGLRSGAGSSVRGLLPDRTVVGGLSTLGRGTEANQFLVAGKRLSDSLYVTFEQALNGQEAVVRASYRISERLSASVQGGTINGLRLVWSMLW